MPELQSIIASRDVDNPMALWLELHFKFDELCRQKDPPIDLLKRICEYASWCSTRTDLDVATAASLGFYEHLIDYEAVRRVLPQIIELKDYVSLKPLLLTRKSEEEYAEGLKHFETLPAKRRA